MHGGNKAGVIKLLVKYYQESKGLVDGDPHSPRPCLLEQFKEEERCDEYGLVVLAYQEKGNRLIVLCPRLEEWILEAAKEAGVDVEDYGLPKDAVELHGRVNIEIDRFSELVKDLVRRSKRLELCRKGSGFLSVYQEFDIQSPA